MLWTWMKTIPPELVMFVFRWDCMLILCIIFGWSLMFLYRRNLMQNTLPLQIAAMTASVIIGTSLDLGFIRHLYPEARNMLLSVTAVAFCILPFFSVLYVIRRAGNQILARKIFYAAGMAMLLIQILVSCLMHGGGS